VVTLALTPLSLLLFGQVSLVGLVANLLAIPWVTLLVTPLALGGVLLAPLWDAAALAVQGLGAVLQAMAALPLATVSMAAPPLWAGAAGVLGGLVLAMRWPWSLRLLGVPLLLPVLLWQAPRPAPGEFELLAADKAPVPQPTSSQSRPLGASSQSRKRGANNRLHRPM
jgi:competence protein ComEC